MALNPDRSSLKSSVLSRFVRYVRIDTQSSHESATCPSTNKQFDLARQLVAELHSLGITDAGVNENCYVFATIPATVTAVAPPIGFLAHLDTSPDVSGAGVNPRIIENYTGGDIGIRRDPPVVLSAAESPELLCAIGHTIVTAGGDTLLGADDKAGVAAIVTAAEYLMRHREIPHGVIRIGFTPDEEIGRGVDKFDIAAFGADCSYTVDGGFTGEINDETFSADAAVVTIAGRDMHPGYALGRMVNAVRIAAALIARLPGHMAPETTGGRDGYIHPHAVSGNAGGATVKLLLRDFSEAGLEQQRALLRSVVGDLSEQYPGARLSLDITATYRNMRDALRSRADIVSRLERAVRAADIEPVIKPIRGGTDGAALTARGLLTPNIFTAACNPHSLTEWVDIDGLAKCSEVLIRLATEGDYWGGQA
jgi:tripeptide aminopeptidase